MAYREERINEFFNSRGLMIAMGLVYVVVSYFAFASGRFSASIASGNGVFFNDIDRLLGHPLASYGLNTACVLAIITLTVLLNKTYTFIREVTFIFGSTFLALQLACPYACTQFCTGTGLCLLTLVVQLYMFSTYQQKQVAQREDISRVFFLVALCSDVPICVFSACGAVFHRISTDARHQFPRCVGCLVRTYHPILACYRLGAYRPRHSPAASLRTSA
ncbi:MAG: hypothetical protein L6U16_07715 [Porphyromonadaceae bacterium]|nr:MAG: hypothetical protein L6U16_07715 [Porphyromonadaceae bacterium]